MYPSLCDPDPHLLVYACANDCVTPRFTLCVQPRLRLLQNLVSSTEFACLLVDHGSREVGV
jgi:hypothetical protein